MWMTIWNFSSSWYTRPRAVVMTEGNQHGLAGARKRRDLPGFETLTRSSATMQNLSLSSVPGAAYFKA